ncbi:amidohydrolase family protein [Zhouia sp. PK063]|uniref:amidohydrolase family protein n=1 Tax=Zhouia sp. PK063 TaxID=3373602 RepID=UPI00379046D9
MKKIKYIILTAALAFNFIAHAQQTPAPKQSKAILITGATAHIGNGKVIENSLIGFKDGKITLVADATTAKIDMTQYPEVIDATGKQIYPGFIAANTTLGLVEIDAVKASDDESEMGSIIPNVRSLIAYNAESQVVETMRPNGVLMAQITPRGGSFSGTSSIVQLDAWNWQDAAVKVDDGVHLNWPNSFTRGRWWLGEDAGLKPNKDYQNQVDKAVNFLAQAKAYGKNKPAAENLMFDAVQGLFDGSKQLFIHVDDAKGITDAVNFIHKTGVKKLVIVGGDEADEVTTILKANNVPVLISKPHRLPNTEDENIKHSFLLAKELTDAGILVGIENSGDMERMNTRNLPFYAGSFAAYGLSKEQALALITSNSAKILGIDATAGTLETGKDATLFISEGDALEMTGNIISKAFIQGRNISLETHQTELWHRYMNKYEHQQEESK